MRDIGCQIGLEERLIDVLISFQLALQVLKKNAEGNTSVNRLYK